jgi:hypothetical protein
MDKEKREQLIGELLSELNRYESASLSTLFVERREDHIEIPRLEGPDLLGLAFA